MLGGSVSVSDVDRQDVAFVAICVACVVLIVPAQLATTILFDATGLDAVAPDVVFVGLLPGIVVALVPIAVAASTYGRRRTVGAAGGILVTYVVIAVYLIRLYALCGGPRC